MAWIELHQGLAQHHKMRRLKRSLGVGIAQAVGHVALFWTWALDATPDGDLSSFESVDIAEQAEWEGDPVAFVEALVAAGLVDREDGRLVIHDWMEYAGRLVEKRRTDAERKRMSRGRPMDIQATAQVTVPNRTVPNQENMSAAADAFAPFEAGGAVAPLEADEQEHVEDTVGSTGLRPAPKPADDEYTPEFAEWWEHYPRKVCRDDAFVAWRRLIRKSSVTSEDLTAGLLRWKVSEEWVGTEKKFLPHPATFLNGGRWKEFPTPANGSRMSLVPDAAPKRLVPPEIAGAPWVGLWVEKCGTGSDAVAVMNLAHALKVDAYEARAKYDRDGLRAAGDWVWQNRQTG